jgi:hypothetical protein
MTICSGERVQSVCEFQSPSFPGSKASITLPGMSCQCVREHLQGCRVKAGADKLGSIQLL